MPPLKQSPLLLSLVMLLGFVMGFVYNSQLDPSGAVSPVPPKLELTSLRGLESLKINYSVLTSSQFQQLRVFGELPVKAPAGGKSNLFQ